MSSEFNGIVAGQSVIKDMSFITFDGTMRPLKKNSDKTFKSLLGHPVDYPSFTYPITVSGASRSIMVTPLMGTADEGLYLRRKDILELALTALPGLKQTRYGAVKQYSGKGFTVSFQFCPQSSYEFESIFELPIQFKQTHSNSIPQKCGILGVTQLVKNAIAFCRGNIYVIEKEKVYAILDKLAAEKLDFTLSKLLVVPDGTLNFINEGKDFPAFCVQEVCRTCNVAASDIIKLSFCKKCIDEKVDERALYCSVDCQRTDWTSRHKDEHKNNLLKKQK